MMFHFADWVIRLIGKLNFLKFRSYVVDCVRNAFMQDQRRTIKIKIKKPKKFNLSKFGETRYSSPLPGNASYPVGRGGTDNTSYLVPGDTR